MHLFSHETVKNMSKFSSKVENVPVKIKFRYARFCLIPIIMSISTGRCWRDFRQNGGGSRIVHLLDILPYRPYTGST